jgi:ABC-type phosphate/phosphonate transport system substrate-binding protein
MDRLMIGAVAYDPKVVPIWEGIREYFAGAPAEMDFVLFSNYEAQVEALLSGTVDVAWNTNLAYVRVVAATGGKCRVLAMRDTDLGFRTLLVGKVGALNAPADLVGKTLALGSRDSAQAAILPVHFLAAEGLELDRNYVVVRFDTDVGKHGDTGRSEVDALRAVLAGEAVAAAVGAASWDTYVRAGDVPPGELAPFWTSPPYNHCNFTALPSLDPMAADAWTAHLMAMDWENPGHRRILEMEGLRRWVETELNGYQPLFDAVEASASLEPDDIECRSVEELS